MSWGLSIIIAGVLAGAGLAIDKLLLHRQKAWLQDRLIAYWNSVDESRIRDLTGWMTLYYLRFMRRIFGKNMFAVRAVFVSLVLSTFITWAILVFFNDFNFELDRWPGNWPVAGKYVLVNWVFDFATISISIFLMRKILRAGTLKRFVYIILDIAAGMALAYLCITLADRWVTPDWDWFLFWRVLYDFYTDLDFHKNTMAIIYANTTLIPTLVYLLFLTALSMSQPIIACLRRAALHVLELSTEDINKTVFLYTGILLGLLQFTIKTLYEIIKL